MSSEAERAAVFDAIQEWVHARDQVRGFSAPFKARTEAKRRGEMQAALDAYRTAIERRVLAQQPTLREIVRIYGKLSDYEDQGIFLCGPGHPLWESTLRELCQTIRKEFGPLMGPDLMSMPIAAQTQETSG